MRFAVVLILAGLFSSACYDPPRPACAFLCGTDSSCPSAYYCATDGWCKRESVPDSFVCDVASVDASVADAPVADAPVVDAPELIDADVDATELDAPIDADIDAPVDAIGIDASPAMLAITTQSPLNFATLPQTTSDFRTVTVRNGGGIETSALTVNVTGASYAVVAGQDSCSGETLLPSTTCTFQVRFNPATVGTHTGVASATATVGGAVSINLTGMATPSLTASSTVPFGSIMVGQMASLGVTVTNSGTTTSGTITVTAPTGAFSITTDTCAGDTVPAGDTCTVTVQFAPTATGAQASSIVLNATPGGPRTVNLTGTGQ